MVQGKRFAILAAAGALSLGCSLLRNGADSESLWRATQRFPEGAGVYRMDCAHCHGFSGEGIDGRPRVMGPGALPVKQKEELGARTELARAGRVGGAEGAVEQQIRRRAEFRTAADFYSFVAVRMPAPHVSEGSLSEREYWAVLNYILDAHGVSLPSGGADRSSAGNVDLGR